MRTSPLARKRGDSRNMIQHAEFRYSPSGAVVSLTLYDGAIPASATADIGPVKERAGIPGTAKRTAQGKGGKAGISTEPQFTQLEPVSSPANTTDDTGSSCTRGPYQVFKGMCRPDESPEQKVARPHMHEGPKFKIQYSSLVLSQATTWFRTEVLLYLSAAWSTSSEARRPPKPLPF